MKKWLFSLAILLSLFLALNVIIQTASADKKELDEIKQAIKEKGAKWEAGETSVSELSDADKKLRCGTIISDVKLKGTLPSIVGAGQTSSDLSYNWDTGSNRLSGDYVTPIKDQGNCGSCWAFSAVGQLESVQKIYRSLNTDPDLSEQYLVSCETNNFGCNGGYMDRAYTFLKTNGTTSEECFKYAQLTTSKEVRCRPCTKPQFVKIVGWAPVERTVAALKSSISLHPTSVTFNVYYDFYSYTSGVYERVSTKKVGGHAVLAIGWDDNAGNGKGAFICKNSWGTGWGENSSGGTIGERGFFRIAYSQVTDALVLFGGGAGNYYMDGSGNPAPPRSESTAVLWGQMKI